MVATEAASSGVLERAAVAVCFAVLALLAVRRAADHGPFALVAAIGGAAVAWLCLAILSRVVYALDAPARQQYGWPGITSVIGSGFLLMIPFTVLAVIADVGLGWNATVAFGSAGIMTSGATAGAELATLGDGRAIHWAVPTAGGVVTAVAWITVCALAGAAGR